MAVVKFIDPEYLKRVAKAPDMAALKQRAYDALRLKEGAHVVDVGCGPAIDTLALASIVGSKGFVFGVDMDQTMVVAANKAAVEAGVGSYTQHQVGDATKLPIDSGSVDALFCERVLQHIPYEGCRVAVKEMLRVLKPGGRLVIVDTDWATLSIATANPPLERRIVGLHALSFANPFSGRNLLSLLRRAGGVEDVSAEPIAVRLTYESVAFLLSDTIARAVNTNPALYPERSLAMPAAQEFIAELEGARNYQQWSAHLTLVLAAATKGNVNG